MSTDDRTESERRYEREEVREILDAYLEALDEGAVSSVPFTDDVVLENPQTRDEGQPVQGRENVVELLEILAADMPRVELDRHIIDGNQACSIFEWEATDGTVVPTVDCFEIQDGAIARVRIFFDTAVFL